MNEIHMGLAEIMLTVNLTVMMIFFVLGLMYTARALREIHIALNSRLTQLLEATRDIAHAAGIEEERGKPTERR
jgi:hypothetical protein